MPELTSSEQPEDVASFSAEDARELARLVDLLLRNHSPASETDRTLLVERARKVFNERNRRSHFFPRHLFDEPGWDMLLALYLTDFAGGRQTIGQLVSWIGAPQTTALRWLDYLEAHRLVSRQQHERHRRAVIIELTDTGRQRLDQYFATVS